MHAASAAARLSAFLRRAAYVLDAMVSLPDGKDQLFLPCGSVRRKGERRVLGRDVGNRHPEPKEARLGCTPSVRSSPRLRKCFLFPAGVMPHKHADLSASIERHASAVFNFRHVGRR